MDSHIRSIVKAVTWRAGGTVVTILVAWLILDEVGQALGIGFLDTAVKLGAYYAHERLWDRIPIGRQKEPEYYL